MIQHKVMMTAQDFPASVKESEKEVKAAAEQIEDKTIKPARSSLTVVDTLSS